MNPKAVPQAGLGSRFGFSSLSLLVVGLMSVVLAGSALAAPGIGKGGQVHACYRVKGKAKGAMRVVPANKKCRRGERKLAWSITGPAGRQGADGPGGAQGQPGANGTNGSSGTSAATVATLETQVASLTVQLEGLKGVLQGVNNGELTGALATVKGLTNIGLTKAVAGLPALDSLCNQASLLTGGLNSLNGGIGGITVLGLAGLSLDFTSLPATLSPYTCPAH